MTTPAMIIVYTPEQRAAAEAHWAEVRAGLHKSKPHVYVTSAPETIAACRFNACQHIEAAARLMRRAEDLATGEMT